MKVLSIILYLPLIIKYTYCSESNASAGSIRTVRSSHNRMMHASEAGKTDFSFATMVIWVQHLEYLNEKGDIVTDVSKHYCTGNIVATKWVLSAAQCFQPLIDKQDKQNLDNGKSLKLVPYGGTVHVGEDWIIIKHIYIHPSYRYPSPIDIDVALLELVKAFLIPNPLHTISIAVFAEQFPTDTQEIKLRDCWVIGYGKANRSSKNDYVKKLRGFPATAAGNLYCKHLRKRLDNTVTEYYATYVSCALGVGTEVYKKGIKEVHRGMTCEGDVGGGLVCGGRLVGITSQRWESELCGGENAFSSFINVAHPKVLYWIKKYVNPVHVKANEAAYDDEHIFLRSGLSKASLTGSPTKSISIVVVTLSAIVVIQF